MKLKTKLMEIVFLAAVSLCFSQDLTDTRLRIAVPPIRAETNNPTVLALSGTVRQSLLLNLGIMGAFRVVPADSELADGPTAVRDFAWSRGIDRVVLGRIVPWESGGFEIRISLYIASQDASTERSETVRSVFDIFGAIDRLTLSLLEELSGERLAYGRLELVPRGLDGVWELFINGYPAGRQTREVARLVSGRHRIRITQERMFGETTLLEREIEVEDGRTMTVDFEIPPMLPVEMVRLSDMLGSVRQSLRSGEFDAWGLPMLQEARRAIAAAYPCPELDALRSMEEGIGAELRVRGLEMTVETMRGVNDASLLRDLSIAYREISAGNRWIDLAYRLLRTYHSYAYQYYAGAVRAMAAGNLIQAASLVSVLDMYSAGLPAEFLARLRFAEAEQRRYSELLASGGTDAAGLHGLAVQSFGEAIVARNPTGITVPGGTSALLVQTDPPGLEVRVNDVSYGASPVLLREGFVTEASIEVLDAGESVVEVDMPLKDGVNAFFFGLPSTAISGTAAILEEGWQDERYVEVQERTENRRRWFFPVSCGILIILETLNVYIQPGLSALWSYGSDWYFGLSVSMGIPGPIGAYLPEILIAAMYRPLFRFIGHYFSVPLPLDLSGGYPIGLNYCLLLQKFMVGIRAGVLLVRPSPLTPQPMIGFLFGYVF